MPQQLVLTFSDDPVDVPLWESFSPSHRDRVVEVYTQLAIRAARRTLPRSASDNPAPLPGTDEERTQHD